MTKRHLYIFNPEHDLALASGETNYMAPASARQMVADLALLPMWYAEKEDAVLASSAYNVEFLKTIEGLFGDFPQLVTPPGLVASEEFEITPWGWNSALRKRLLSSGVDESQLPSLGYMEQLRIYSHRSQAVDLLPKLQLNECFCGESFYLQTQEECRCFVEERITCLLKAPLSGSGRGLNWCKGMFTTFISDWCARVTTLQGGVIGEPVYNKVEDFAMEFSSDGKGQISFVGYSMFQTSGSGMYAGSKLLSDERIVHLLSEYVPMEELLKLQMHLEEELTSLLGRFYNGYLGVDMMICHFPDEVPVYRIHPCVEINLRMNMGVVAHFLTDRCLTSGVEGVFQIAYYPMVEQALEEHRKMAAFFPLCIEDGRIKSGYLPLVPVTRHSRYRAWVLVRSV